MTVYIGSVELCTAVTADGKIFSQAAEVKMAVHKGFVKLCTAVTADCDISNQATQAKMTVHYDLYQGILYVDGWCASFKIIYIFFETLMTLL